MITYEEVLTKNNIKELYSIYFGNKNSLSEDITISNDIIEYIDVAKKAEELKYIKIMDVGMQEYYNSVSEFVKNCNSEIKIESQTIGSLSKEEFLQAEEIINDIVAQINPLWDTKQKLAYVHYKMGELVTYVPDFNFFGKNINNSVAKNSRNIWKSVIEQKSVCNGITNLQRNILSRIGIETKELSSGGHSFLLTKLEEGNIITDATWDLANTLYKAKPQYFGLTYEKLRKQEEGLSNAHKLDNPPENVIEITDEELRQIYFSIGLTTENKKFLFPLLEKIQEANSKEYNSIGEKVSIFLDDVAKDFPMEISHLAESRSILETVVRDLGIKSEFIRTKFVYDIYDEKNENPYLVFHINSENTNDIIKILDVKDSKTEFRNVSVEEFDKNYKVHSLDTTQPFWKKYIKEKENINMEIDFDKEKTI